MDFEKLTAEQRLVAEQAVLTFQALEQAAKHAPMGQGFARVESALHAKGFDHLREMMRLAISAHPEAQKKGSAVSPVPAGSVLRFDAGPTRRS